MNHVPPAVDAFILLSVYGGVAAAFIYGIVCEINKKGK